MQSAPVAAPITFLVGGEQYIAINAGWGGGAAQIERMSGTAMNRAAARLLVFKLGGHRQLPPLPPGTTALRLRTSQEIYWDRIAIVYAEPLPDARRQVLPMRAALPGATALMQRSTVCWASVCWICCCTAPAAGRDRPHSER